MRDQPCDLGIDAQNMEHPYSQPPRAIFRRRISWYPCSVSETEHIWILLHLFLTQVP